MHQRIVVESATKTRKRRAQRLTILSIIPGESCFCSSVLTILSRKTAKSCFRS